ncbi:hypothetical protein [uncultured Bradyrhizobium sp.]|uniref:hypothetical protein n=1 Tax=uncultured Bradyrhizobium sp. TaxID=199684 RepID=UPI0035CAE3C9
MIKIIPCVAAPVVGIALLMSPFGLRPLLAQDHAQMHHEQVTTPTKKSKAKKRMSARNIDAAPEVPAMIHGKMAGADHGGHEMKGFLGPYGMGREGSGTSWQPDNSPHYGIHAQYGEWMTMWHAMFNGIYDNQGGPRGDTKTFVSGMVMAMAQRQIEASTFGFRVMMSPEPFMGASGYPNLLATGETADGRMHLVDRQHPHDLFMELAATYSYQFAKTSSVYLYAGLPGEPALGPSAFMHRTSGLDNPEAPITHHWLDSTHIVFGVLTAGVVLDTVKLEASTFRGREPDQYRFDIEAPKFDSYSARASWNPTKELSMQVSWGHIESPEQLVPTVSENRITASLAYTKQFGDENLWATTLAWGRKYNSPGNTLNGFLAESELIFKNGITLFGRAERVENDELLERGEVVTGFDRHPVYGVSKVSAGGIYDFIRTQNMKFGVGALASRYGIPDALKPDYGDPTSYMIFARLKIQ